MLAFLGILPKQRVFGVKVSPYLAGREEGDAPIVTSWTLLMSLTSGLPLLLANSERLTSERTAAATFLAVKQLASKDASVLAVIGSGKLAEDHLRHIGDLRHWKQIRIFSPSLSEDIERFGQLTSILECEDIVRSRSSDAAAKGADVILLCTSSGTPVIDWEYLKPSALVTSISTNAPKAHEIAPEALPHMEVYCDYAKTTPQVAGEMVLAVESKLWSPSAIKGDLTTLSSGQKREDFSRPAFFRSVGLGIEDVAVAWCLYRAMALESFSLLAEQLTRQEFNDFSKLMSQMWKKETD